MFTARVQGTLTVERPAGSVEVESATTVANRLRQLFVTADAVVDEVTIAKVDTAIYCACIELDAACDVPCGYRQLLSDMAAWLTGEITVVDGNTNTAVKHVFREGTLASFEGRIVYADERTANEALIREVVNNAADDVNDAAALPDTGAIDAINLVVNTALHRLFDDPDASLTEVIDAGYEIDGEEIAEAGSTLDVVLGWIDS